MESEKEWRIDICVECKVRNGDSSKKKVFKCGLCERWFCKKHLNPRLAFIKDLEAIEKIPEIRVLYYTEVEGKEGHPDFEYSRRKFRELKIEEKRRNELIKQALDRMNHYYVETEDSEVEVPEIFVDAEADRKKRVAKLLKWEPDKLQISESLFGEGKTVTYENKYGYDFVVPIEVYSVKEYRNRLNNAGTLAEVEKIINDYYITSKQGNKHVIKESQKQDVKFPKGEETVQTRYGFVVPREVYSNPLYREYLDHADNMKSVKVIVDEYYRKYGKRKKFEEPKKKKHWWQLQ